MCTTESHTAVQDTICGPIHPPKQVHLLKLWVINLSVFHTNLYTGMEVSLYMHINNSPLIYRQQHSTKYTQGTKYQQETC